jgi:hypothetical protein
MGDQQGLAALLARLRAATGIEVVSESTPRPNRGGDSRFRVYLDVEAAAPRKRR